MRSLKFCIVLFLVHFAFTHPAFTHPAFADPLNTKIEVWNSSGVAVANYPVSAVVPLNYSEFGDTNNLRLENSSGGNVPVQFSIEKRWTAKGNSIREVRAFFKADVPGNGKTDFYLKEGAAATSNNPVSVVDGSGSIVVSNGILSFTISKTSFNFLDQVSINGRTVIDNQSTDGGYHVNRFGNLLRDNAPCTNLTPRVFEVEESGPEIAIIRVEWPTYIVQDSSDSCFATFPEDKDPVPGAVNWFILRSGSSSIKVQHTTLNNGITPYRNGKEGDGLYGWPYFYQESGINFRPAFSSPQIRIGYDSTSFLTSSNVRATQSASNVFSIAGGPSGVASNFAQVYAADGLGFSIVHPFFEMKYPNGWNYDAGGNVFTFLTAPDGCSTCEGVDVSSSPFAEAPSGSGLYVIEDMSSQGITFQMNFFETPPSEQSERETHTVLRNRPAGLVEPETYRTTGVTASLFGILPTMTETSNTVSNDFSEFRAHKSIFGVDWGRFSPCGGGGIGYAGWDYLMQRPPSFSRNEVHLYAESTRGQYPPHYWGGVSSPTKYRALEQGPDILYSGTVSTGHYATEFSSSAYCKSNPFRAHNYPTGSFNERVPNKNYPANADGLFSAYPRDLSHGWILRPWHNPAHDPSSVHFKRAYELFLQGYADQYLSDMSDTGSPDKFGFRVQEGYTSEGGEFPTNSVRGRGHAIKAMAASYGESGDPSTLDAIDRIFRGILKVQMASGAASFDNTVSFQAGYLAHGVLDSMALVPRDHDVFKRGYSILFGGGERPGLPGLVDAIIASKAGYYSEPGCTTCGSSGTSTTIIDPLAVAAYLVATVPNPYTNDRNPAKATEIINFLVDYLGDGVNGGSRPYSIDSDWPNHNWQGDSFGRLCSVIYAWSQESDPLQWPSLVGRTLQNPIPHLPLNGVPETPGAPGNLRLRVLN